MRRHVLRTIPPYVWTFSALLIGIALGGFLGDYLTYVATATKAFISLIVLIVPLLIFAALSPAIATLIRRGLAGKFAGCVVLWYVLTSTVAGLIGLVLSSALFGIPLTSETKGLWGEAANMLTALGAQGGASRPLLAIIGAVILGALAAWITPLYRVLSQIEKGITKLGYGLGYVLLPILFCFGITLGVGFGAKQGLSYYMSMSFYTAALCLLWLTLYIGIFMKLVAKQPIGKLLAQYYVPTALFCAGTGSSLATLPINLANVKKWGVRDEVADFIVPFGAVVNMDGSAMTFVAFAPFVVGYIFDYDISWTVLFTAWPAIVLFTIAAPGLPAGMGTALWSGTLFAGMLGLEEPTKQEFIAYWVALTTGVPDMFRASTNVTCDGFMAILFDRFFEKFFQKAAPRYRITGD